MSDTRDEIKYLKVQRLQPNPFQPRGRIEKEDLADLVKSVEKHGVLEPLIVAKTPAGLQIIAGERRWRAAREVGLEEVPAVVKKTTPRGMLEMAIVENIQRTDLNAVERGKAFDQLKREFNYTFQQVADRIGKSVSFVSNTIRLLRLPDLIKDGIVRGHIDEGHARAMQAIQNDHMLIQVYKQVVKENASVRRTEELTRQAIRILEDREKKKEQGEEVQDNDDDTNEQLLNSQIEQWRDKLRSSFQHTKDVKLSRSRQMTKVVITLKGNPEETQQDLEKILKLSELED